MDRQMRNAWTVALRSGEYKQGGGTFKQNGCYCCLGVLCDVHPGLVLEKSEKDSYWGTSLRSTAAFLQEELDLLGLSENQQARLIQMNDSRKVFNEIADWIEAEL